MRILIITRLPAGRGEGAVSMGRVRMAAEYNAARAGSGNAGRLVR
jgi:hypothetical protein